MPYSVIVEGTNISSCEEQCSGFFSAILVFSSNEDDAHNRALRLAKKTWSKKYLSYATDSRADFAVDEVIPISLFSYIYSLFFSLPVFNRVESIPHKNLILY